MNRQAADDPAHAAPSDEGRLEVSAKILNFEPGLYSVDISAPRTVRGVSGMTVPCVRLDPINVGETARAFVSALSEHALIQPGDPSSYLRVRGGTTSVLLTVYKLAGAMAPPELRISLIKQASVRGAEPAFAQAMASAPLTVLAHIERAGDVTGQGGHWIGQPGSRNAVEGFSILAGGTVSPEDIEYQAVLGSDWTTPWHNSGEFCGSRGLSLPLLGVRVRLRGETAKTHHIAYWGSFVGADEIGPIEDGAVCGGNGAALEALRVVLRQRHAAATTALVGPSGSASGNARGDARADAAGPAPQPERSPALPGTPPGKAKARPASQPAKPVAAGKKSEPSAAKAKPTKKEQSIPSRFRRG